MRMERVEADRLRRLRGREVRGCQERRLAARVVEDGAVDEMREVAPPERVGERGHAESHGCREARVAAQRPAPAHGEDVQAIVRILEDLVLAPQPDGL